MLNMISALNGYHTAKFETVITSDYLFILYLFVIILRSVNLNIKRGYYYHYCYAARLSHTCHSLAPINLLANLVAFLHCRWQIKRVQRAGQSVKKVRVQKRVTRPVMDSDMGRRENSAIG